MKTVRMKKTYKEFSPTELTKAFDDYNMFFYLVGMPGFWINEVKLPKKFVKIYDKVSFVSDKVCVCGLISYIVAFYTQNNMTSEQKFELFMRFQSLSIINYDYYVFSYYRAEVNDIFYHLVVLMKEHYYNKEIQLQMVKNIKLFVRVLSVTLGCFFFGKAAAGLVKTVLYGDVFYPYVGVWPDVNYTSTLGLIGAIFNVGLAGLITIRPAGVYALIVIILMTHTYQFKDLQSYFYELEDIFKDKTLSQSEKEEKYEDGFKRGIYMHSVCLSCVRQCQRVCRTIFSFQLLLILLNLLMSMMVVISGDLSTKLTEAPLVGVHLTGLAIFMWNAGDLTFEAERVTNAMYGSGWQNCYGQSSVRVRKLVVYSMAISQTPVVLKAFGVVEMSYESYMAIIKASYSLLSVFS